MRKAAITRIIIASAAIIILSAVLIYGLTGGGKRMFRFGFFGFNSYSYANAELYNVGDAEVTPDGITKLDINWIAGSVTITTHSGSEISIFENDSGRLDEEEKLRWLVKDGVLYIKYSAPRRVFEFRNFISDTKRLTVYIPQTMADMLGNATVEAVSADLLLEGISAYELNLKTVSGNIKADIENKAEKLLVKTVSGDVNIKASGDEVKLESVSGDVNLSGEFGRLEADSVSGDITIKSGNCPHTVRLKAVSGDIELTIPENKGFTASYSVVSGSFKCAFPTMNSSKKAVYGDGSATFSFNTVSGDITIKKA